jgi:hypothetical protein
MDGFVLMNMMRSSNSITLVVWACIMRLCAILININGNVHTVL